MRCNLTVRQRAAYVAAGAVLAGSARADLGPTALRAALVVLGLVIAIEGFAGY